MKPYQERVEQEAKELRIKCDKLYAFIDSEIFEGLAGVDKARLTVQVYYMGAYLGILLERIDAWEVAKAT